MAAIHRVVQQDLQEKITRENRERYDEWKNHLDQQEIGNDNHAFDEPEHIEKM